jgi:Leucine-rich repeat (LRR) protein
MLFVFEGEKQLFRGVLTTEELKIRKKVDELNFTSQQITNQRLKLLIESQQSKIDFISLLEINLYDNQLTSLAADTFKSFPNLTVISLSSNHIISLDKDVFSKTPNLNLLFLDNNRLTTLDRSIFSKLRKLTVLYLDNNQITTVDRDIFSKLISLNELCLDHNRFAQIDHITFARLVNLTKLDLSHNHLKSPLDPGLFIPMTKLEKLNLSNNIQLKRENINDLKEKLKNISDLII